jgi:hypothetical protein
MFTVSNLGQVSYKTANLTPNQNTKNNDSDKITSPLFFRGAGANLDKLSFSKKHNGDVFIKTKTQEEKHPKPPKSQPRNFVEWLYSEKYVYLP